MVKRSVGFILKVCLILTLILPISRLARAGAVPDNSIEQAAKSVLFVRSYDWKGTLLREGMGYFSQQDGAITTVVPVVEGGYFVEAISPDGTEHVIEEINPLSESSGLLFARPEEKPADLNFIENVAPFPVGGDNVWIPALDILDGGSLEKATVLEARAVPGLGKYLYLRTSVPAGMAGSPVFNSKGEVAGMVLLPGEGEDNACIIVSTDLIRSSYGVSGEVVSLLTWADSLTDPWYEKDKGLYLKGVMTYHAGSYSKAADYLERLASSKGPGYRKRRLVLGECYRHMGETQKAIDIYEKALKWEKKPGDLHLCLARMYLKMDRITDARRLWEDVARREGEGAVSGIMAALLLEAAGKSSEALAVAMKAAEINPRNPAAQGTVGELLNRQGRFDEAFLILQNSASLDPQGEEFTGEFCYATVRSQRYPRAVKVCGRAVQSGWNKARNLLHLGDAFAASGKVEKALESYRLSIAADPHDLRAWCRTGDLLARAGLYEEAVAVYLDALDVFQDSTWLHFKLGKVHGLVGNREAAIRQVHFLKGANQALADQLALLLMANSQGDNP